MVLLVVALLVVGTGSEGGLGPVLDCGDGEFVLLGREADTASVLVMEWQDKQAMPMVILCLCLILDVWLCFLVIC